MSFLSAKYASLGLYRRGKCPGEARNFSKSPSLYSSPTPCLYLFFSKVSEFQSPFHSHTLSFSLSLTHTHTHTHTLSLFFFLFLSLSLHPSLSLFSANSQLISYLYFHPSLSLFSRVLITSHFRSLCITITIQISFQLIDLAPPDIGIHARKRNP